MPAWFSPSGSTYSKPGRLLPHHWTGGSKGLRNLALPFGFVVVLLSLAPGCQKGDSPTLSNATPSAPPRQESGTTPWFIDITEKSGLNFVHDAGPLGKYFMPESMGSGAALFDFDNDGRLDIYLLQNGGPNSRSTN